MLGYLMGEVWAVVPVILRAFENAHPGIFLFLPHNKPITAVNAKGCFQRCTISRPLPQIRYDGIGTRTPETRGNFRSEPAISIFDFGQFVGGRIEGGQEEIKRTALAFFRIELHPAAMVYDRTVNH